MLRTKVTADQAPIDGVLGGELNALSAASRGQLRPTFAALKTKSADDQATALRGVLAVGPAMPNWSPEPMGTAVATVTLAGPTEKKDFAFTGRTADAEEWVATYSDGVTFKLVAPKAPTPATTTTPSRKPPRPPASCPSWRAR